jgi:acid stress-induced BolA-like protein IbaG/YrbA
VNDSSLSGSGLAAQIRRAITESLPGADVQVAASSPGHFTIGVTSEEFRGKSRLACQRLVYKAITPLMQGDRAPVHAIDHLETKTPEIA